MDSEAVGAGRCSGGSGGGLSVLDALAALPAVFDALTSDQWWRLGEAELAGAVRALTVAESRAAAAQVAVVGEAVSRGLPAQAGAKDGAGWLRGLVPVTPRHAAARAALATRLTDPGLGPTRAAFAAGEVSAGHAGVTSRCLVDLAALPEPVDPVTRAEVQTLLIRTAARVDPGQLGKAARAVLYRLDPGAGERLANDEDAQDRARQLHLSQDGTGMWQLYGVLAPVAGATLAAALDPLATPQPATDGSPDPRTAGMRRADAVVQLAELALAARPGHPGALPSRGGSPTRVIVSGDLATFLGHFTRPGLPAATVTTADPGGWPISPLTAQVAACDGEIVPILTDGHGRALDVGDTIYPFPPRIRRAIEHRDRHCTYPGCHAPPPWCHAHHLIAFGRNGRPGGPTSEANGTLLCGRHHRHVHARGWTGRLHDGKVHWHPPGRGQPRNDLDHAEPPANTVIGPEFERALTHLAHQWLQRNPHHDPQPIDSG